MKKSLLLSAAALALAASFAHGAGVQPEKRGMDELYRAALKEGGRLVVYAGGDTPEQQNGIKAAFEKRFPGITLDTVVDYSKVHDARIDQQLADKNVAADVVQLQTLQDYPRWKAEGVLLPYKPIGWDKIYKDFKDPDGA